MLLIVLLSYLGLGIFLARYFSRNDRGPKEPKSLYGAAFGFGVLAIILAGVIEPLVLPASLEPEKAHTLAFGLLFISSLGVGLIEEAVKFIPFYFFIRKRSYFNEVTDGIISFGMVGLTFGIIEDISYSLSYSDIGFGRLVFGPFSHAAFSALIGWGAARVKVEKKPFRYIPLLFVASLLLHGIYDLGIFSQRAPLLALSILISAAINIGLFILFQVATEEDQKMGLSALGSNKFCRNCGKPNPQHFLFCEACGKKA